MSGLLSGIRSVVNPILNALEVLFLGKQQREFLAGDIQDYQAFAYPPFDTTFGNAFGMFTPIWANHTGSRVDVVDWDMDIFTSNTTGNGAVRGQDVNGVIYYGSPLDLHGRHDLVVCQNAINITNFIANYTMSLHGLGDLGVTNPSNDQVDQNGLAEEDGQIVWTWPFLVKAGCDTFNEDTTRLYNGHGILIEKTGILLLVTRASSSFYLPDQPGFAPIWYSYTSGAVLNVMFLFCAKPQASYVGVDQLSAYGNVEETRNPDVVTEGGISVL